MLLVLMADAIIADHSRNLNETSWSLVRLELAKNWWLRRYPLACDVCAPYVDRCCATISESLAPTEWVGNEKGAFTGTERRTKGWFEIADGGAPRLDDIQGLPHTIRPALYRVLHEKQILRVGSSQPKTVDVFVIGTVETKPSEKV